jgi:hypothetical protein
MADARYGHTLTPLPNGKGLVAGGVSPQNNSLATAELYDPTAQPPVVPEAPGAILIPLMGIAVVGSVFIWRRRRAQTSG